MDVIRAIKLQKIHNNDKITDVDKYIFTYFESYNIIKSIEDGDLYLVSKNKTEYISIFKKNNQYLVLYSTKFKNSIIKKFNISEIEFKLYIYVFFDKYLPTHGSNITITESYSVK